MKIINHSYENSYESASKGTIKNETMNDIQDKKKMWI